VEVYPADFSLDLVEADVVEPLKARPSYGTNPVVGNQEVLLPSHKDVFSLGGVSNHDGALACLFLEGTEGGKFGPMAQVNLHVGAPIIMFGEEVVLGSDNLALKVCCESWMVFSEACV
jgi:hypothetical protein